ncbi:MAG TPA: hypothetical protein VLX30_08415 [Burkholderiales bacterium]|nr:hypothetical protein [Burkholderiales bacterium]
MKRSHRVRQSEVAPYSPANHSGTRNYRLIGPETVGAQHLLIVTSERARVLVIYAPPCGEDPAKVV